MIVPMIVAVFVAIKRHYERYEQQLAITPADVRSFTGAADFLHSAAVTPDGKVIVAGGQDGVLRVWDGATPEPKASFK